MRILYVEDNETNQMLVGRVVRARRHKVLFSEEGEQALKMLESDPDIDLVLLDIELAGSMNGEEVVRQMRAREDKRPVVAVTAYAMMGDRERFLEAGCDQYLPKPLVITDLLALIDHYEVAFESPQVEATPANGSSAVKSEDVRSQPTAPTQNEVTPSVESAPSPSAGMEAAPQQDAAIPDADKPVDSDAENDAGNKAEELPDEDVSEESEPASEQPKAEPVGMTVQATDPSTTSPKSISPVNSPGAMSSSNGKPPSGASSAGDHRS